MPIGIELRQLVVRLYAEGCGDPIEFAHFSDAELHAELPIALRQPHLVNLLESVKIGGGWLRKMIPFEPFDHDKTVEPCRHSEASHLDFATQ
jgi:hypothetical protein